MPDLTVQGVAERLDAAPSTVRKWLGEGRFPNAYRVNPRLWLIPERDLESFERPLMGNPKRRKGETMMIQSVTPSKAMSRARVHAVAVVEEGGQYTLTNETLTPEEWQALLDSPDTAQVERVESLTGWQPFTVAYRVLSIQDTEFDEEGEAPAAHGAWYFAKEEA